MKKISKREALDKVVHLFDDAEAVAGANLALATNCIKKARRIAMKSRIRIPQHLKRRFCKNCGVYFIPAKTYRVRMKNKKVIYSCLKCKHLMRIPATKK